MIASARIPGVNPLPNTFALGMRVDATSYADAVRRIFDWASKGESRTVAVANVHMVMEGYDHLPYQRLVNDCDLVTPDGMPLVWLLRARATRNATRVYGPDLTRELLAKAHEQRAPIGFYGGSTRALDALLAVVHKEYPDAPIVYACAPPFRTLQPDEEQRVIEDIRSSGARILFVGLGCPKQERWVAAHRGRVPAVMIGVGATFDFMSGVKVQAPQWMQKWGLEWLFRMITEPRRLFGRYARHVPRFIVLIAHQLWIERAQKGHMAG
jgi:N-acetylglucosaminyldiphosphoundecaprenol N-acetyl-beta-D-mannosaminyltransferase